MKRLLAVGLVLLMGLGMRAQTPNELADEVDGYYLTAEELDLLLGPIALYPDPLLAVLLPAATETGEIVRAVRFLNSGGAGDGIETQVWSDSVKAMARYPEVLRWLDENLEWTSKVGEAFLRQPVGVMESIQRLREVARALGNLQTTAEQRVEVDYVEGGIDILPASDDSLYVPIYAPEIVYTRPAVYGAGPQMRFGPRHTVGSWLKYDWDWKNRRVVTWTKTEFRPKGYWGQGRGDRYRGVAQLQEWCPKERRGQVQSKWWGARRQQQAVRAGGSHGGGGGGGMNVRKAAQSRGR